MARQPADSTSVYQALNNVTMGISVIIFIIWTAVTYLEFPKMAVVCSLLYAVVLVQGCIENGVKAILYTTILYTTISAVWVAGLYFMILVLLPESSVGTIVLGFAVQYFTVVKILGTGTGVGAVALSLVSCTIRIAVWVLVGSPGVVITSFLGGLLGLFVRWSLDEVGGFSAATNVAALSAQIAGSQDEFPAVLVLGLVAALVVGRCVVGSMVGRNLRVSAAVSFIVSGLGLLIVRWWVLEVLLPSYYDRIVIALGYNS